MPTPPLASTTKDKVNTFFNFPWFHSDKYKFVRRPFSTVVELMTFSVSICVTKESKYLIIASVQAEQVKKCSLPNYWQKCPIFQKRTEPDNISSRMCGKNFPSSQHVQNL